MRAIGTNYQVLGLSGTAEPYLRAALELRRSVLGSEHEDVALSLSNLASLLRQRGDCTAAEPLYRESLAMYRNLLGDEHPYVATSLSNLGTLSYDKGDYAAAEPLLREALVDRHECV